MLMPINDKSDKNVILITVDDAPQGESTEKLLDLFDTYHVKAIWFLNGIYAIKHPELVKEIHDHGHIIGNHSWSHPYLKKLSETETKEEIIKLNDWIEQTIGERPKYFRPPFGQMTDAARAVLAKENMQMMNWTWGSLDWELKSADKISENVLNHATPGTNYLFHDKNITVEAMKKSYLLYKNAVSILPYRRKSARKHMRMKAQTGDRTVHQKRRMRKPKCFASLSSNHRETLLKMMKLQSKTSHTLPHAR